MRSEVNPQSLKVKGGTQPEIFQGTVDAITRELTTDPTSFWRDALATDGPIEIWEIAGERWLYNGNHRYLYLITSNGGGKVFYVKNLNFSKFFSDLILI